MQNKVSVQNSSELAELLPCELSIESFVWSILFDRLTIYTDLVDFAVF